MTHGFDLGLVPWHEGGGRDAVAMPLGGIGTGTVAIAGDGSLRQWQLSGPGNHGGFVPDSGFAIRCSRPGRSDLIRGLEAVPAHGDPSAPETSDGRVPDGLRARHAVLPPLARSRFRAAYPVAEARFDDDELPVRASIQAFCPFVPLDVDRSSLPAALFEVVVENPTDGVLTGWLAASLQNTTGWDGVAPVDGTRCLGYGGAVNRVRRDAASTSVVMSNAVLPSDAPGYGQQVLATSGSGAHVLEQFASTGDLVAFLRGRYLVDEHGGPEVAGEGSRGGIGPARGPSPAGQTWNGALAVPFRLAPGARTSVRFWHAWWFPNRYVDFVQFGRFEPGRGRLWLGSAVAAQYPDAVAVADRVAHEWDDLARRTRPWIDAFRGLPPGDAEHLLAQGSMLRVPSLFRAGDGSVFFFEGVQGVSTGGWADHGGSCPLNCTHVGNYMQAAARLFPALERDMRDTELDVMQAPDGSIPHRVRVPTTHRQPWGEPIGGPVEPALDGMLGTVLKSLREVQQGAGTDWLRHRWPALQRLLGHVRAHWETDDGVLRGPQPSTFDIPVHGANPYIGSLWLAALLATERMAVLVDDREASRLARGTFERASAAYDALTFGGEYFQQHLEPDDPTEGSWGSGCLADQLVGQWWAHQLGLGHVLPPDHVRAALRSIVRYNFVPSFRDRAPAGRVFADDDDAGVLNCTWPHGGRPEKSVWYADEVWTGTELQLAAHLEFEGLAEQSRRVLDAVTARHDGRRRNPFNHVECGDHYVRAMSGFSLLEARSGLRYDATAGGWVDAGGADGTFPVFGGGGWGTATRSGGRVRLDLVESTATVVTLERGAVRRLRRQPIRGRVAG